MIPTHIWIDTSMDLIVIFPRECNKSMIIEVAKRDHGGSQQSLSNMLIFVHYYIHLPPPHLPKYSWIGFLSYMAYPPPLSWIETLPSPTNFGRSCLNYKVPSWKWTLHITPNRWSNQSVQQVHRNLFEMLCF
jgi:hypothetical protein